MLTITMRVSAYRIIPKHGETELAIWNHYIDRPRLPATIQFGAYIFEIMDMETLTKGINSQVCGVWKILVDRELRLSRTIQFLVPANRIDYGDVTLYYGKNATPAEIIEKLEDIEGFYV